MRVHTVVIELNIVVAGAVVPGACVVGVRHALGQLEAAGCSHGVADAEEGNRGGKGCWKR